EVLPRRLMVLLELDVPVRAVEVQHRVQRVVVELAVVLDRGHLGQCRQNSSNPSWTRVTSRGVPNSSNLYIWGTSHLRAMMSPAKQWASPKLVFPAPITPRMCFRLRSSLRNLMTCLGTAPRPLPPPQVGVIRTKSSSTTRGSSFG